MPEPSITTPFLTPGRTASSAPPIRARWATLVDVAVSYSVVAGAASPEPPWVACHGYGAAPSGQEPSRCCSGGREPGTAVGGLPFVGGLPRCETRVRLPRTISTSRA